MDINVGYKPIRDAYKKLGHRFFANGDYNLNIGGIRSENSTSDKFDDLVFAVYFIGGKPHFHTWPATTDPGKHWLLNPFSKDGTAILVPGQHPGAYKLGIHGRTGKYPYKALEQVKPMSYVRDDNRDHILDFNLYRDPELLIKHLFKAVIKSNIHRASKWRILQLIGRYSAGCQVLQSAADFDMLIYLAEKSAKTWGNSFTYTLFEERDFQ